MLTDGGFVRLSGTCVLTRAGKAFTDVWSVHVIYRFQAVVDIKGVSDSFQGFLASVCFVIVRDLAQGIACACRR